jgi:hypothetical protein
MYRMRTGYLECGVFGLWTGIEELAALFSRYEKTSTFFGGISA